MTRQVAIDLACKRVVADNESLHGDALRIFYFLTQKAQCEESELPFIYRDALEAVRLEFRKVMQ